MGADPCIDATGARRYRALMPAPPTIEGLSAVAANYDAILCDVWGVVHNGVRAWAPAIDALQRFRAGGGRVALITNAPRPAGPVVAQLAGLGVPTEGEAAAFDAIVTSGDVTRRLVAQHSDEPILHIGTDAELSLYAGLDVTLDDEVDARAVVVTGLRHDEREHPDDYREELTRLVRRGLPMICANPDIVVERGHRLAWCAGALARIYREIGGETLIAGKPHAPIYEAATDALAALGPRPDPARTLAVGDGMPTDVRGAQDNGFPLLYVSAGIHSAEYGDADSPDPVRLAAFLAEHGAAPAHTMPRLVW